MHSNFKPTNITIKVAALFTSAAMTTLIFGSQLGLAEFYSSKSDATLVAARVLSAIDKPGCNSSVQ